MLGFWKWNTPAESNPLTVEECKHHTQVMMNIILWTTGSSVAIYRGIAGSSGINQFIWLLLTDDSEQVNFSAYALNAYLKYRLVFIEVTGLILLPDTSQQVLSK